MLADESSFTTTRRLQAKGPRAKGARLGPWPLTLSQRRRALVGLRLCLPGGRNGKALRTVPGKIDFRVRMSEPPSVSGCVLLVCSLKMMIIFN
jgi:hypothetical protein